MRTAVAALAAFLSCLAVTTAGVAAPGFATTSLNMRAGPSTEYPVVATIPKAGAIEIHACLSGALWCDVSWSGERGWASARYLAVKRKDSTLLIPGHRAELDLPTTTFGQRTYWDRHYRNRGVYQELSRWEDRYSTRSNRLNDGSFGRYERPNLPPAADYRARTPGWDPGAFRSRTRPPAFSRGSGRQGVYDSRGAYRGLD